MKKCVDCGREISQTSIRCKKCAKSGKLNPNFGVKITDERRQLLSKIHIGEKNKMWRGNNVGYSALHDYVKFHFSKPEACQCCGKKSILLDLANKGIYDRDINNWEYLCRKCHMTKDGRLNNFIKKPKN